MSHATHAETYQMLTPIPGLVKLRRRLRGAALASLALGAGLLALGAWGDPRHLWGNLLLAGYNLTCVGLGGLFFLALQSITSARWSDPVLAPLHAMPRVLPFAAVLMLALWLGAPTLYPWARPEALHHEAALAGRAAWLNPGFFFGRVALFFGLWIGLGSVLLRRHRAAAPFIVIFGVTFALASFDWIMSVEPTWYSTLFAIYGFAGMFVQAIAILAISSVALNRLGLAPGLDQSRNHDLGKLLFAFSCFWAYIWLSQSLLIWYSNIPEETAPLRGLMTGPWSPLFYLNVVLNFVVPFFVLMPRKAKTNPRILVAVSLVLLAGHWLDLYLNVFPPLTGGEAPRIGAAEAGGVLLTLGAAHLSVWRRMTRTRPTLWEDRFATGVAAYDAQHQGLLDQVNELYGLIEGFSPDRETELRDAFRTFVEQVKAHELSEDEALRKSGIPGAEGHVAAHEAYLHRLEAVLARGRFGHEAHGGILDLLAEFRRHFDAPGEQQLLDHLRSHTH